MPGSFSVGERVWLERWELNKGFFLGEYEVVAVDKASVGLREVGVSFLMAPLCQVTTLASL